MFGCVFIRFIVCVRLHLLALSSFFCTRFFFRSAGTKIDAVPYKYGNGFKFICFFLDPMMASRFKSTSESYFFFVGFAEKKCHPEKIPCVFFYFFTWVFYALGLEIIQHIFSILMGPYTYLIHILHIHMHACESLTIIIFMIIFLIGFNA